MSILLIPIAISAIRIYKVKVLNNFSLESANLPMHVIIESDDCVLLNGIIGLKFTIPTHLFSEDVVKDSPPVNAR
jgi:hypothetical protein